MHKLKKPLFILLFSSLLFSSSVTNKKTITQVNAGPLPSSINMTTMDDEGLALYYTKKGGFVNVRGEALLHSLHDVIKDHVEYNYTSDSDRLVYKIIDRNWDLSPASEINLNNYNYNDNPYIHKLYADYNYNDPDRFTGSDGYVTFDKEHIWAQSLGAFGRATGAGSDFHALWPSDQAGNRHAHSNYNFAEPTLDITDKENDKGGYVGRYGNLPGEPNRVFEPLDQYKGDIARAMMYMAARYYIYESATKPKLKLINGSPAAVTASPTIPGLAGDLATLLRWHEEDPVDLYEVRRNNLLYYNYQQNRNPFIDHPEWAHFAFDPEYVHPEGKLGASSDEEGSLGEIVPEELLGLTIEGAPETLKLGQKFDLRHLNFTAHFRVKGDEDVTRYRETALQVEMPDTSKLGLTALNAEYTYLDTVKHATVYINVTNKDVQVGDKEVFASDLFISEYIEGASYNKALEVYNGTGSNVTLTNTYELRLYTNGSESASPTLKLSGTLAHNATYNVVISRAIQELLNKAHATSNVANFNGNDAVGLYKNGVLIDLIGEIGVDQIWSGVGANGVSGKTQKNTLIRADFIKAPNIFFSWEEWNVYPNDTLQYFGTHYMDPITYGITSATQANAWALYFLDVTSNYCSELEGYDLAGGPWSNLALEYNYMDTTTKALFKTAVPDTNDTTGVSGAKARYLFLITKYPELALNNFMVDENNDVIFDRPSDTVKAASTNGVVLISLLSIITLIGYFFLNKKKITI